MVDGLMFFFGMMVWMVKNRNKEFGLPKFLLKKKMFQQKKLIFTVSSESLSDESICNYHEESNKDGLISLFLDILTLLASNNHLTVVPPFVEPHLGASKMFGRTQFSG